MSSFDSRKKGARAETYRTWGDEAREMALADGTEPCLAGEPPSNGE